MANEQAEQELGKLLKQVTVGQLRTMGMFMEKIDTRIDGSFKIQTPGMNPNKRVFYVLQTKTVDESQAGNMNVTPAEDQDTKKKEMEVLEQLIRDYEWRNRLKEEEYEELPPEFNPEEERKSKEEMIEFLNGRTDGLLEAYEQVTGEMFSVKLDKPEYSNMDEAMKGKSQTLTQARNRYQELKDELGVE